MAGAQATEDVLESSIVDSVNFSFYRAQELKRLSVKNITKPDLLDANNLPVPDGLYDPAMGPIENLSIHRCTTCGLMPNECLGHFGRIELARMVYNPLLFKSLLGLLQIICLQCHDFQIDPKLVKRYTSQLELILKGDLIGSKALGEALGEGDEEGGCDCIDISDESFQNSERCTWTSVQYAEALSIISQLLKKREMSCKRCGYPNPTISSPIFGWLNKGKINYDGDGSKKIAGATDEQNKELRGGQEHLFPTEVVGILKDLWGKEPRFFHLISDLQQSTLSIAERKTGYEMFFLEVVLVPPNRFRPGFRSPDGILEHPQNERLSQVVKANDAFRSQLTAKADSSDIVKSWMNLQRCITLLFDSSKTIRRADKEIIGIRQLVEMKSGIIQKNMMGKNVHFAFRSVISPDPYLAINEIGIPQYFAMNLTYPERVTAWNAKALQLAVRNGPEVHAGATYCRDGPIFKLRDSTHRRSVSKKLACSRADAKLGEGPESDYNQKVVYRHLKDGDIVLVNRQPTLHKSSMMAHVVRVLKGQNTIHMHPVNCSTYNADFDGDEMNVHVPQDEMSRAEAMNIVNANKQYNVSSSGDPIRGLIEAI